MTRKEAIQALQDGKKVVHRHFADNEYIYFKDGRVRDENGYRLGSIQDFMSYRQSETFNDGWEIHQDKS